MGVETSRFEALHRLARRYVEDGLRFADALEEAARVERAFGRETFKSSAIYQLEKTVATLRAENHALHAEIKELERQLNPVAAETEAFEHEIESRRAHEREAEAERRACA